MINESILIVEDNPTNLKLVQVLLTREGYNVKTAVDAIDAIELLKSFRPSLILMDLQLPGMDGLELTRLLKSNELNQEIIIIALTAYAMKGDEDKAIKAGCDGYITKPFDTRTLGKTIATFLEKIKKE
jgi:two-component system cell cycle response regulator DivK